MVAVVIPWFLALTSLAAINNTQIRTDHGPVYEPRPNDGLVYVYDVNILFWLAPERIIFAEAEYVINFTCIMKCRARNASVLFCTLEDRVTQNVDVKHFRHFQRVQTGNESFEIDFDEAGVRSLRGSASTVNDKKFRLIKMIVSQFNVGTNFEKRKTFAFTTNETSSLGECETVFNILSSTCTKNPMREGLRMRSVLYDSLGDSVLIRKRRNTRICDRPNEITLIDNRESILPTVTSSYSEMRICPDSFESSTSLEGKAIIINEDKQASVFQQITKVRLENVERTEEDLPTFAADTAVDTIYLHRDVDNNESET